MGIHLRLVAFFMIFLLPFMRFADYFRAPAETFTYTKSEGAEKPGRRKADYSFGRGDILVLPEGDDANDGSETAPVKTLQRAKELAQEKTENDITVWLGGGLYEISEPLVFEDSKKSISFCAVPGEEVRISGSHSIDGWQEDEVNGRRCLSAPVPASKAFTTLLRGDTPLPVTRYPESGYFYVRETDHSGALFTDETTPWKNWSYGDLRITPDRNQKILAFHSPEGVTLRLLHFWCGEISQVAGYDEKSGRIMLTTPLSMRVEEGQKYYFENVRETLNKPGEWYYDKESARIYYIPIEGETADNLDLRFAVTDKLITIDNCSNISFDGVTFCDTCSPFPELEGHNHWLAQYGMRHPQAEFDCGGAVELTDSQNIAFHNCVFRNIGTCAVKFVHADKDCSIDCCDLIGIGASGIYIDGAERGGDEEITERITVSDTLIKSYGRYFYSGCGILLTHARGCELKNNEISDGYYTAISVGWVWGYAPSVTNNIIIENNLIYNIGQGWLSDMGGIYTLGRQPGTIIRGNVIHDVAADPDEGGYGGWGIYLDEGSSKIEVEKNLVYRCLSQTFHQHYGEDNVITNNIFALGGEGALRSSYTGAEHQLGYDDPDNHNEFTLKRNIFLTDNTPVFAEFGNNNFKDEGNIYWDLRNHSHVFCNWWSDPNLFTRVFERGIKKLGHFTDAVLEDPGFLDPANDDYTLPDINESLDKIGFERFDYESAGTLTQR
jgi:hypothetical protein